MSLTFLLKLLAFIVRRLQANSDAKARDAENIKVTIDGLIQKRMVAMEESAKAQAIAKNIVKFTSV